jgi:hypothetical protein
MSLVPYFAVTSGANFEAKGKEAKSQAARGLGTAPTQIPLRAIVFEARRQ